MAKRKNTIRKIEKAVVSFDGNGEHRVASSATDHFAGEGVPSLARGPPSAPADARRDGRFLALFDERARQVAGERVRSALRADRQSRALSLHRHPRFCRRQVTRVDVGGASRLAARRRAVAWRSRRSTQPTRRHKARPVLLEKKAPAGVSTWKVEHVQQQGPLTAASQPRHFRQLGALGTVWPRK